jgi:DNA-binding transcriptional LysR family regulator
MMVRRDEHERRSDDEEPKSAREPWLGVELRHLVALVAVANEGSFSAAAAQLGYAQSAVNQQISALEGIVDARLVERSRGRAPVTLTRAGALLLGHADGIFAELRTAYTDVCEQLPRRPGTLVLGVLTEVTVNLLPRLLERFRPSSTDVAVVVREHCAVQDLIDGLRGGALDAVVCEPPASDDRLGSRPLLRDRFILLARADDRVTRCGRTRLLAELAARPLIALRESAAISQLHALMAAVGLEPSWALRIDDAVSVPALVRAGVGCAVVPRLSARRPRPGLAMIELEDLLAPRTIAFLWRREDDGSALLAALRDEACAAAAEIAAEDPS